MKASDIIVQAGTTLYDQGNTRWTEEELLNYINQAQLEIVRKVPDANSVMESVPMVAGSRQELPESAIRLLRVIRNTGVDGESPGKAIMPTSRSSMDATDPDWHTRTDSEVEHSIYDPDASRTVWWAYPGMAPQQTNHVELVYSKRPDPIADADTELDLKDQYMNPVIDWVMYRAWTKDAEHGGNLEMARHYFQAFYQDLGLQMQVKMTVDPNTSVRGGGSRGPV